MVIISNNIFLFLIAKYGQYKVRINLVNSLGWKEILNKWIQALDPFISLPIIRTINNKNIDIIYKYFIYLIMCFIFILEKTISSM